MYDEAIEKLKRSKTVKVFAPTGLWSTTKDKEKWIQACGILLASLIMAS